MITIREKLIKIRSDSGLSQQDFAEKLNISRQTVTRWESGKSTPSSAQILNICREFGLDANELLSGEHAAVKQSAKTIGIKLIPLTVIGVIFAVQFF